MLLVLFLTTPVMNMITTRVTQPIFEVISPFDFKIKLIINKLKAKARISNSMPQFFGSSCNSVPCFIFLIVFTEGNCCFFVTAFNKPPLYIRRRFITNKFISFECVCMASPIIKNNFIWCIYIKLTNS